MKKVRQQTHLVKRNGVYWYRQKIPIDLIEHYQRPSEEFRFSLKTKDQADAITLAAAHTMRFNEEFRAVRERQEEQDNPRPKLTKIDPAIIPQLARAAFNRAMVEDERLRFQGLAIHSQERITILGHEPENDPRKQAIEAIRAAASIGDYSAFIPTAQALLRAAGYAFEVAPIDRTH